MSAFLLSTLVGAGIIFVAELGDKSQLMAMAFATRYKIRDVILGLTAATAVVHLASVGIGYAIGDAFESYQPTIELIAGLAFVFFALWTLRGDELTDEERDKALGAKAFAPMLVVGLFFFLAELGDKTMLATITLAARDESFAASAGTWLGSTVGMVAADALAIVVGAVLGKKLPEKVVRYGAAALFVLFGVLLAVSGFRAM